MNLKPIRTEAEYEAALRAVAPYFDNEPDVGTDETDRFEMLVMLIEAYEASHYQIALPDPVEASWRASRSGGCDESCLAERPTGSCA